MRSRAFALGLCTVLGTAGLVVAQAPHAAAPILHEPIPDLDPERPAPTIGGGHDKGGTPTAFAAGDKVLPRPSLDKAMPAHAGANREPVLGTRDFGADRDTTMKSDENTGSDGTLHYVSVFNPAVLPFKRMSVFDAVDPAFTLHIDRAALTEVPVGGTTDPKTRDRFWGDVLVKLEPGQDVPLPSVAPDMRILSYEAKPRVRLQFSKDGSDNFYVRSDEASASGTYRLVFYADADAGYFAPSLPARRYKVRDVANRAPPELKPAIPANVLADARITMEKLGVDPNMDLGVAFNVLVEYFRDFKAGDIVHPTGDTYRDLCDSKTGVCRHRSFAFMITANALGIPTRLVTNEAHAFVEVWFPERSWQRIDLGGAALHMDVAGANHKTLHRPRSEDPFVKPPAYRQNYTQLEGDIRGLSDQQIAEKKQPLDEAPPSGATGANGGATTAAAAQAKANDSGGSLTPDRITPDPTLPAVTQDPKKPTPRLLVTQASTSAYRGDVIHIEGMARVDGKPLPDRIVYVFLSPAGANGAHPIQIGSPKTGADGTFKVELPLPPQLDLSTYEIYLSSLEDAHFNAALSD
ncbi:MAG: transglutaminase domain-containing protein [Kofleriaceae bacterium]